MIYFYPLYRDYGPVPFTEPLRINHTVRRDGTGYIKVVLHDKPLFEKEYPNEQALNQDYDKIVGTMYQMARDKEEGLYDFDMRVFGFKEQV